MQFITGTTNSGGGQQSNQSTGGKDYGGLDFKMIWDCKMVPQVKTLHLVAPTIQEKAAWISDISQVKILQYVMFILRYIHCRINIFVLLSTGILCSLQLMSIFNHTIFNGKKMFVK